MKTIFYNNCNQKVRLEAQGQTYIVESGQQTEVSLYGDLPSIISVITLEKNKDSFLNVAVKSVYECQPTKEGDIIEIYREKYRHDDIKLVRLVLMQGESECKRIEEVVEQDELKKEWRRYKVKDIYGAHLFGFFLEILPVLVIAIIYDLITSKFRWDILLLIIGILYLLSIVAELIGDFWGGRFFSFLLKKLGIKTSFASFSQVKKQLSPSYMTSYFASEVRLSEMEELDRNFEWVKKQS